MLPLILAPYLTRRVITRGGRPRHPGIIFVCTSSVNFNSFDYGNTGAVRAPGMSHTTTRNIHFAGTRDTTTADAPSHCTVLANRCT